MAKNKFALKKLSKSEKLIRHARSVAKKSLEKRRRLRRRKKTNLISAK